MCIYVYVQFPCHKDCHGEVWVNFCTNDEARESPKLSTIDYFLMCRDGSFLLAPFKFTGKELCLKCASKQSSSSNNMSATHYRETYGRLSKLFDGVWDRRMAMDNKIWDKLFITETRILRKNAEVEAAVQEREARVKPQQQKKIGGTYETMESKVLRKKAEVELAVQETEARVKTQQQKIDGTYETERDQRIMRISAAADKLARELEETKIRFNF